MNKILVISFVVFVLSSLMVNAVMSSNGLDYRKLYEADESWCDSLYIQVTGINITSDEYMLQDCGESDTINRWYCNCEQDEEFEVIFVNGADDSKTYVVDIYATGEHIKRVVSKNNLDSIASYVSPKPDLDKFEFDTAVLDDRISVFDRSLDSVKRDIIDLKKERKTEVFTTINNTILETSFVENSYNDTNLIIRIKVLEDKNSKTKSILLLFGIIIMVLTFLIWFFKIKKDKLEKNKLEMKKIEME